MFKCTELIRETKAKLISGPRNAFFKGVSLDSRKIKKGEIFIAIKGEKFDGHDFIPGAIKKGAACIIQQTGHKVSDLSARVVILEVKDTLKALGEIARFHRERFKIPVIAITGSNGKTTTKEMIARVLSGSYNVLKNTGTQNNQIGLPLTLLNLKSEYDIAVLEIGTNHFGEVENLAKICRPNIAVITNIGPAHLKYFGSLKGVFQEKNSLLKNLEHPSIAVLNADDAYLSKKVAGKQKNLFVLGFGLKNHTDFFVDNIRHLEEGLSFRVNQKYDFNLHALGRHNIYNALGAISLARIFGVSYRQIALRLRNFVFPKSRLNFISLNDIRFIDDTYNSNPLSLKQALDTLAGLKIKGRKIVVMGDMLELGEDEELFHRNVGKEIAKVCDNFISVGKLSRITGTCAKDFGLDGQSIFACESSREAREILFKRISPKKEDVILVKGSRLMQMEQVFK